jgi:hypothetical protein
MKMEGQSSPCRLYETHTLALIRSFILNSSHNLSSTSLISAKISDIGMITGVSDCPVGVEELVHSTNDLRIQHRS